MLNIISSAVTVLLSVNLVAFLLSPNNSRTYKTANWLLIITVPVTLFVDCIFLLTPTLLSVCFGILVAQSFALLTLIFTRESCSECLYRILFDLYFVTIPVFGIVAIVTAVNFG
jgi:hypothetical protein